MPPGPAVRVRRIYEEPSDQDGARILVDRIWPRGMTKERAHLDQWDKEVAPSTALRKWYDHDPERFAEFERRYRAELAGEEGAEAVERLSDVAGERTVTLLTATKRTEISAATVLARLLLARLSGQSI
ncbi:MAG TPA: DUF488 family protein [Acidimicrobiales bacterium]|nr:DUF488 family protein [Acidimicrobiales bacterium]